ncbi:endoplasmic oxidoreductin [Dendrothele bispora CBS 962.96]|uniref:Endoplasmic oxidoreductin n=1 Tax=Dendrothele bispora (strain CBS 962.96) TaxID=1314807 RepID=A0A4S8MEM9_DENBC|nr:endoplasmic oxidoreductin [Dendrothele bispora CBS 962.96]
MIYSNHLPQRILRITPLLLPILTLQTNAASSLESSTLLQPNTLLSQDSVVGGLAPAQNILGQSSSSKLGLNQEWIDISECQNVKPTGPIDTTLCDYETVDELNDELYENLREISKAPFFRYLQMDLYRGCPFWEDEETCTASTCSIETIDESEIPEQWRTKTLSSIDPLPADYRQLAKGCYFKDSDYCISEDPTSITGEYYDLSFIPERYTGYSGAGAHQIWRSIYEDNCMTASPSEGSLIEEQCLEAKVYRRIVSGLHASISTHICLDYLNQTTGEWAPNLQCYVHRVASHPERLENIYFNVVLLLRAVARLAPHLSVYEYRISTEDVADTKAIDRVISLAHKAGRFDETVMFNGRDAHALKEEFKYHFRNVTRIMDCIDCDKCRLWGKVQTTGVATALKVLFELDDDALSLTPNSALFQRSEIVALFNTLYRFSESLHAVQQFRQMWTEETNTFTRFEDLSDVLRGDRELNQNFLDKVVNKTCEKVGSIYQFCKDGTAGCVLMASKLWSKGLECLDSLARVSPVPSTHSDSEL